MQNVIIAVEKFKTDLVSVKTEQLKLQAFIDSLPDGTKIEVYYSVVLDPSEKSLAQLAKVHVLMKQLATDTGHSLIEIKDIIKIKCGLINHATGEIKSFQFCSKTELAEAIQCCIELGNELGIHLH